MNSINFRIKVSQTKRTDFENKIAEHDNTDVHDLQIGNYILANVLFRLPINTSISYKT